MQTDEINGVLGRQLAKNQTLPAHVARFYAHLVLLLKMMGKKPEGNTIDLVISHFVDVLISLNQFVLAPYYLSQVSEEVQKRKLIQLLRCKSWSLSAFGFSRKFRRCKRNHAEGGSCASLRMWNRSQRSMLVRISGRQERDGLQW